MMKIPTSLFQEMTDFLTPLTCFANENARRALLLDAGLDDAPDLLDLTGGARQFVVLLLRSLEHFGTLDDGQPAVVALLNGVARLHGSDKRATIQKFCARLQTPENPPVTATPDKHEERLNDLKRQLKDTVPGSEEERQIRREIEALTASPEKKTALRYDIFLSRDGRDAAQISAFADELTRAGAALWFDARDLRPGLLWKEGAQEGAANSRTMAACVGASGVGQWDIPELRAIMDDFLKRQRPVIVVFLPGCPENLPIPSFLRQAAQCDARQGLNDPNARQQLLQIIQHRA